MPGSGGFYAVAWDGIFSIFVTLGCIVLAWVLLQEVRYDRFMRHPQSPRARLLQLMIAIVMGRLAAGFILDYWHWTGSIRWLFQ